MTPRIPQNIFNWLADWILTMPPRDPSDRYVELALAIRQVNRLSPLPPELRSEVVQELRRFHRTSLPSGSTITQLMGYQIAFLGEYELRFLFREIFGNATYFFDTHSLNPVIIDCGSNIGMSALFFKKLYPSARVVCFEPDPVTFACLSRNVKQNKLDNIELHQYALGKSDGQIDFYRSRLEQTSRLAMSTVAGRCDDSMKIKVNSRKLSEFLDRDVDLLKMDIEGAEEDVLHELATSGKLRFVRRMHVEYHHHIDPRKNALSRILKILEDNGFGYQIRTIPGEWPTASRFQDIALYCYLLPNGW